MKIKLSANSIVNVSKELEEINLNHGYSIGNVDTVGKSNWTKKILGKIDKTISYVKPISEESSLVVEYIAKAAKFLSIQEETKEKHVEELKIHINVDSTFNNFLKLAGKKTALMIYDFAPDTAIKIYSNVEELLNTETAYIKKIQKEIHMGTKIFEKNGYSTFGYNLKQEIGLEDATSLIVFHEASHSFEEINRNVYGFQLGSFMAEMKVLTQIITGVEKKIKELNEVITTKKDIFGVNEVDKYYWGNISTLTGEIYADIGAVLLQRNKDIYENKHNKEKDIKIVDALISGRNKEQASLLKTSSEKIYVNSFTHLTSLALIDIKKIYESNEIEDKILSQQEIHSICMKGVKAGLSRVLLTSMKSNNENIGQIKLIFALIDINENQKDLDLNIKEIKSNSYKEGISKLKEYAGEEWVKKLNEISDEVKENGMRSRSIWNGVFHKEIYEIEKQKSMENNKLLKEIDVSHSEKEIVRKIPINISMQDISASIKKCKAEFSEKDTIQKNTAFQRKIN